MSLNIETAIRRIKSLVDSLRCVFCDNLDGVRLRYICGHSACQDCVESSDSCILCLTPPDTPHVDPIVDESLTEQVKNAQDLLNKFQDLFHVDVYKWCRLSEQLKIEKDFFPECIQAPTKYSNIKKNSSGFIENSQESYYPGEFIKPLKSPTMSFNFIHQWLDKSKDFPLKPQKRKPFSDLNVNINHNSPIKKRADLILDKVIEQSENFNSLRKTSYPKRTHIKKGTPLKTCSRNVASKCKLTATLKTNLSDNCDTHKLASKNEKEESGIEVDKDPIIIDDTQSDKVDKDRQALLAVLEAENIEHDSLSILREDHDASSDYKVYKVPFYKKAKLHESCKYCQTEPTVKIPASTFKPLQITIENDTFTTTIKVTNNEIQSTNAKTSKSVQTDCSGFYETIIRHDDSIKASQNLFNYDENIVSFGLERTERESNVGRPKSLIVIDSDSDTNDGSSLQVTAEVHRSCEQVDYKILAPVTSPVNRARKRPRGHTPTSTDSSEKENCDPNKQKKSKKKKKLKFL